jgi:hypothetical protein
LSKLSPLVTGRRPMATKTTSASICDSARKNRISGVTRLYRN